MNRPAPSVPAVSHDKRLRAIALLLAPAFVGHTIQLLSEDVPWAPWAGTRYWTTPGWHLVLPPWVILAIAGGLAAAVAGLALRRTRPWMIAVIVLYVAHYFTYPYRIRNHMTLLLASLLAIGGAWLLGGLSGAVDRLGRGPHARLVDRWAVNGVALVLCITYVFAALHKTNTGFLTFGPASAAYRGVNDFWVYGDLGDRAPRWAVATATYGTLVVEYGFPIVARLSSTLRPFLVLGLLLFHFPHVAVMNVADYPMIASTFYPSLFTAGHWRILERYLARPSRWNVGGALLGAAAELWWLPYGGAMSAFGVGVCMLWGWAAGSLLPMGLSRLAARRKAEGPAS